MAVKAINTQLLKELFKKAGGFFNVMEKVNIITAENGTCIAELKIEKEHINQMGGLHGGLAATMIDTYACGAFLTHPKSGGDPGASVDLHVRYFKTAGIGDVIVLKAETERVGKQLAYMKCQVTNKETGEIVSKGTLTLFIMRGLAAKL